MGLQPVTLHLPEAVYRRLQRAAEATQQSLEDVVLQTITGNLPPSVDDMPAELQDEIIALQTLAEDQLWAAARSVMDPVQQRRLEYLLRKNGRGTLTQREREELERLGQEADHLTLRKAYAYALLRWRGYPLPTLEALESQV
ncbi:MAG: hypothetical protein ACE5I2_07595 [Anaerolineae bacterium]